MTSVDTGRRARIEWALIVIGMIGMLTLLPHYVSEDGTERYSELTQLLAHGKLTNYTYSLIGPLFSAPLWLLGSPFSAPKQINIVAEYNNLLFCAGALFFYWAAKETADRQLLRTFILLMIAASMFNGAVQNYFGDTFTAIGVGFGVAGALMRPAWRASWVAVVLAVANTPATIAGLVLLVVKRVWDRRHLRYALLVAAGAALILGENWLRRGGPFLTGYAGSHGAKTVMPFSGLPGFSYPFWLGVLSVLFSFGKGLLFFAPGLLLPVRRRLQRIGEAGQRLWALHSLWLAFLIGLVAVYAPWWAWYGGVAWGPRFFLFASIPASFALAVHLCRQDRTPAWNLALLAILLLSAWVGIDGALFASTSAVEVPQCVANNYALENLCWYTPDFSVLWNPLVTHLAPGQVRDRDELYALYCLAVALYLALPLTADLVRDARRRVRLSWPEVGRLRGWRW